MSKIDRTVARQQQKIDEGQYYEAHQQLRVIASRYLKQGNYDAAIEILNSGAHLLLKAGQGGSGGDLCLFLLEAYKKANLKVDASCKIRLLALFRCFPPGEPTRRKFSNETIRWSARHGDFPAGDPDLHHVIGTLFAQEGEPYEAEEHLVLGTKDSPEQLANMEYDWYNEDDTHTAPFYAARAVLSYLLLGNLRGANKAMLIFAGRLEQSNENLAVEEIGSEEFKMHVYSSLPLMNFLSLLLHVVQRGAADLFRQLRNHYSGHLKEVPMWTKTLDQIGESYFEIKAPSHKNPLFDMMSNILMGSSGNSGVDSNVRKVEAPPPAYLD